MVEFETEVLDIIVRAPGVKSFRFKRNDDLDFKPGQFFLTSIKIEGKEATKQAEEINGALPDAFDMEYRIPLEYGMSQSGAIRYHSETEGSGIRLNYEIVGALPTNSQKSAIARRLKSGLDENGIFIEYKSQNGQVISAFVMSPVDLNKFWRQAEKAGDMPTLENEVAHLKEKQLNDLLATGVQNPRVVNQFLALDDPIAQNIRGVIEAGIL